MTNQRTDSHAVTGPDLDAARAGYGQWLTRQPLAVRTRTTYLRRVGQFLDWLAGQEPDADVLTDPRARDYAARDFKTYLKTERNAAPASVNLALSAVDHFYRYLGLGAAIVRRETLPRIAPKALTPADQKALLRAFERHDSARNTAIGHLLLYTGLRIGELHALAVSDVPVSTRKGTVIVRSGKGDTYREVPLNAATRTAVTDWLNQRRDLPNANTATALLLTTQGAHLSERAIDRVIRLVGATAGLQLSAHVLRHTFCTNLVRQHNDLILVAELAGHTRLETLRRYSLPTSADRQAAVDALTIAY